MLLMDILLNPTKKCLIKFLLKFNKTVFNKMRANAIKSITKNFSNKNINKKIFKIIEKNLIV